MPSSRASLGFRIQKLRIDNGLSQKELARLCGFPAHQTVSMIEKGLRELKAKELQSLAAALHRDVDSLLSGDEPGTPDQPILWRSPTGRRAHVRSRRRQAEAHFLRKLADYAQVERLCGLEPSQWLDQFQWDWRNPSPTQVTQLARSMAGSLELGARPAFTLARLLEETFLIKIWYEDIGGVGRAACTHGPGGAGMLINSLEAPWRRNYNVARELFYLISRPESAPPDVPTARVDELANTFASSLLLPHSEFDRLLARRRSAGPLTFEDLFQLARDFGVSAEAVLWRLSELKRIKPGDVERLLRDSHLRAIDRHTVGASWLRAPKLPERFVRLCFFGFRRGGMRRSALPALLDCAPDDVRPLFLSYGFDDAEEYSTPVVGS